MGIDNLVKLAVVIVLAATLTEQLPKFKMAIRRTQVKLLQRIQGEQLGFAGSAAFAPPVTDRTTPAPRADRSHGPAPQGFEVL
jgi:hypothetical protein